MHNLDESFWTSKYIAGYTGWDIGSASPPLYQYLCQIDFRTVSILVPGAGNAHEVASGWNLGLLDIHLLDISDAPIKKFLETNPTFPRHQVHHEDFFLHQGAYDLILEQTFFCALAPNLREAYAKKMFDLLKPGGRLVGVLFDREFPYPGPPFGGSKEEYMAYFEPYFEIEKFELCYNSIPARKGTELFIKLRKSDIQD
jgi:methyl halide transferase